MGDKELYEQIGHVWSHFASWREKIVAGYLATLAGLAIAFHQYTSPVARCAMLGAVLVVSLVFWILDSRSAHFVNACQAAGRALEAEKGSYAALSNARFKSRLGYGLAVNVLVAGVIGGAGGGLWIYVPRALESGMSVEAIEFAATLGAVTLLLLQLRDEWRRHCDKKQALLSSARDSSAGATGALTGTGSATLPNKPLHPTLGSGAARPPSDG